MGDELEDNLSEIGMNESPASIDSNPRSKSRIDGLLTLSILASFLIMSITFRVPFFGGTTTLNLLFNELVEKAPLSIFRKGCRFVFFVIFCTFVFDKTIFRFVPRKLKYDCFFYSLFISSLFLFHFD